METFEKSIGQQSQDLTLFVADTLANRSVLPGQETEQQTHAIYGPTCLQPFAIFDPDLQFWKTSEDICLWGSETFCETWPKSGLMQSGNCYQLQPLAHHKKENDCLLWPTPTAHGENVATTMQNIRKRFANGMRYSSRLSQAVAMSTQVNGYLNPAWVEWLMGFPTGWTDLED